MTIDDHPQTRPWTYEEVQELMRLAREGVSDTVISIKTKRTLQEVHAKLAEIGIVAKTET
ncbi:MAG: hypothetical protein EA385_12645 [Salinarimonadaceae bacterium]|nr:MAG: hypothetical protein EA385_12645 [Salinarimonadaceae bacterium]